MGDFRVQQEALQVKNRLRIPRGRQNSRLFRGVRGDVLSISWDRLHLRLPTHLALSY
jgi:hypothetical protein